MGDRVGNLLVIVVDLHPVWWANHSLTEVIQSSLILANAHLLQSPLNKVRCQYWYLCTITYYLYMVTWWILEASIESVIRWDTK